MNIGEQIKKKRKIDKISVPKLALLLGLKQENIYKWERGSKPSDPEEYQKITTWLKLEQIPKSDKDLPHIDKMMSVLVELMQRQNHILDRQTRNVEEKVERIDANLTGALSQVDSLTLLVRSRSEVVMESLSRLEKKPSDHLLKEAGNKAAAILRLSEKQGKNS